MEKGLELLKYLPRVSLANLKFGPHQFKKGKSKRGQYGGKTHGYGQKGSCQRQRFPRLGFEGGNVPFYLKIPIENYYKNHHVRRQYPPLSLKTLQLMLDTNRIDPSEPIDLITLCNSNVYHIDPKSHHYGVHLTDEGMDEFSHKINIEVQHTTEPVIAAIEKNGGVITTAYYDMESLMALVNPLKFFGRGIPIPKRKLPPEDAIKYYTDPKFRGYLADPEKIAEERFILSQKYGYKLPDISKDPEYEMLKFCKDPLQIFEGLEPGWVVNVTDKCILKPVDKDLQEFYSTLP